MVDARGLILISAAGMVLGSSTILSERPEDAKIPAARTDSLWSRLGKHTQTIDRLLVACPGDFDSGYFQRWVRSVQNCLLNRHAYACGRGYSVSPGRPPK